MLTRKFLEGMAAYAEAWPGKVTVGVRQRSRPDSNLDHEEFVPERWPFSVEIRPEDLRQWQARMQRAAMVLLTRNEMVSGVDLTNVRHMVVTEHTLTTRAQMACSDTRNPLGRARRILRYAIEEWRLRRRLGAAAGVQSNGYPTFHVSRRYNANTLLFFDSRIRCDEVIDPEQLERRLSTLGADRPLRLLFSGRLIRIKGVRHLPAFADALRRLGVPFEMRIGGGGEEADALARRIRQLGLEDAVTLTGVLDFREELLPMVRDQVDLFVCPHPQGDPSCTYLETLACGVPIVGYANQAWAGMAAASRAGWATPLGKPEALAGRVAELHADRGRIVEASHEARAFALQHTFEKTMSRRVRQFVECAGLQHAAPTPKGHAG